MNHIDKIRRHIEESVQTKRLILSDEQMLSQIGQAADMIARKGARMAVPEARKHMAWYCKGFAGAAAVRDRLMRANTLADFRAAFERLLSDPLR